MTKPVLPSDLITPDALAAVEELERATEAHELGPAFALAQREAKRLAPRLGVDIATDAALTFAAFGLPYLYFFAEPELWIIALSALVAVVAVSLRWFTRRYTMRAQALWRVTRVLDRWRHMVPAMRDVPQ